MLCYYYNNETATRYFLKLNLSHLPDQKLWRLCGELTRPTPARLKPVAPPAEGNYWKPEIFVGQTKNRRMFFFLPADRKRTAWAAQTRWANRWIDVWGRRSRSSSNSAADPAFAGPPYASLGVNKGFLLLLILQKKNAFFLTSEKNYDDWPPKENPARLAEVWRKCTIYNVYPVKCEGWAYFTRVQFTIGLMIMSAENGRKKRANGPKFYHTSLG